MPDPTPDLLQLAAQVKLLSGDMNRRFEILNADLSRVSADLSRVSDELSGSVSQLNSRMDALSTSRKVALPFKPALVGEWLEGTTSPRLVVRSGVPPFVTSGSMSVVLPNLSRIGAFRASAQISDAALPSFAAPALDISLQRTGVDKDSPEVVVQLSFPVVPGIADPQGDPIPGKEFVDNDRFRYIVFAVLVIQPESPFPLNHLPLFVPQGFVAFESFEVDCIVA